MDEDTDNQNKPLDQPNPFASEAASDTSAAPEVSSTAENNAAPTPSEPNGPSQETKQQNADAPIEPIESDSPAVAPPNPDEQTPLLPAAPSAEPTPSVPAAAHRKPVPIIGIIILLVIVAGLAYGFYRLGYHRAKASMSGSGATTATNIHALKIPTNATMIAQCTPGEGTQYVVPGNIPQGPIYNVWNNQVTGIEYMLGESKIAAMQTQNLSLMGQQYNHIDVMYEAAGHAGFTEPHYHVILSMIPYSQEQKITCGSSSSMAGM